MIEVIASNLSLFGLDKKFYILFQSFIVIDNLLCKYINVILIRIKLNLV
jgi:hypothetical protein